MPQARPSPFRMLSGYFSYTPADLPQPALDPMEGHGAATCYVGWSPKLDRGVCFGTRLEFLHWLLLEGTPEVECFCEYYPPVRLESREFVFDVWLRWHDGREECRTVVTSWNYRGTKSAPLSVPDWAVLVSWARDQGYGCKLISEQYLVDHAKRINNWRRMLPFVKYALGKPDKQLEQAVLAKLRDSPDLPMRELLSLREAEGDTELTAVVARLLHAGKLGADMDNQHFGPNLMLHCSP